MEIVKYILMGIYVIVCFALIVIAMMQSKDDSGASATITGSSSNFYEKNKGRTKEGRLKRWTIILGSVFAILTIVLSIMYVI
ncbi:MAG: preprotein translocase subunit SecG [Clostridia bacterium]|nr:preprotein translocase subunit SecG [Clostridia bacterium]